MAIVDAALQVLTLLGVGIILLVAWALLPAWAAAILSALVVLGMLKQVFGQSPKKHRTVESLLGDGKWLKPEDLESSEGGRGVPAELLHDLGAMVYFGAFAEVGRDKKQATFPKAWSVGRPERVGYADALMASYAQRAAKGYRETIDPDDPEKVLPAEVLAWTGWKLGVDLGPEILKAE